MTSKTIPFLDLITPHQELKQELIDSFTEALEHGHFVGGPAVERFEKHFAEFCQAQFCVGVNSGTDALRFSLIAAGAPPGSIIITVPNTFIATSEAISQAGAVPAFVDVESLTYNMNPEALVSFLRTECYEYREHAMTIHKKSGRIVWAVLPVHLYGQPADMDAIQEVADHFHLKVFEDACQAHGADYYSSKTAKWHRAGSLGLTGSFSFYPGKNLGALGEGGAVVTNDKEIADRIRMLRDHGSSKKYYHSIEGYNGRLDSIQAGFLDIKLRRLAAWNEQRRAIAKRYNLLLADAPEVETPFEPEWTRQNYHLYIIQVSHREELQNHLSESRIGTGLHYPLPLHLQDAYDHLGYKIGDFPVAERLAHRILSLPMFPGLQAEDQEYIASTITSFMHTVTASQLETV